MTPVEQTLPSFPLIFTIEEDGVGGVTGVVPTVSVRDASTTDRYFDWIDSTFKTSGWGLRDAPMGEVGRGVYQKSLPVSPTAAFTIGMILVAEYVVTAPNVLGTDVELFQIVRLQRDVSITRKYTTNRLVELSGTPGTIIAYDDDDVTVLYTHQLRDEFGGSVLPALGTPAQRTRGI